jgi:hypothetical protein
MNYDNINNADVYKIYLVKKRFEHQIESVFGCMTESLVWSEPFGFVERKDMPAYFWNKEEAIKVAAKQSELLKQNGDDLFLFIEIVQTKLPPKERRLGVIKINRIPVNSNELDTKEVLKEILLEEPVVYIPDPLQQSAFNDAEEWNKINEAKTKG